MEVISHPVKRKGRGNLSERRGKGQEKEKRRRSVGEVRV